MRNHFRSVFVLAIVLGCCWLAGSAQSTFQKTYGGSFDVIANDIRPTADSGFVVAATVFGPGAGEYDQYMLRLDKQGNTIWGRTFGGPGWDYGNSAAEAADGGFIFAGASFSFSNGQDDMLVHRTDAAGNVLWSRRIGGGNFDRVTRILALPDTTFLIAGNTHTYSFGTNYPEPYLIKLDANGTVLWNRVYYGFDPDYMRSIITTSDGGYALCGQTRTWGAGLYDAFLIKINSTGIFQWGRVYGGTGVDRAWDLVQTQDGGYAFTGTTESYGVGVQDILLVKTNSNGQVSWARVYGEAGLDDGRGLVEDNNGDLIIAGHSRSFSNNGFDDMLAIKVSNTGNLVWSWKYGGDDYDQAIRVALSRDGGFALAGYSQSFQAQNRDIFIVKLDSSGIAPCFTDSARVLITVPNLSVASFTPTTNSGLSISAVSPQTAPLAPTQLDSICNSCDFPTAEFEYFLNNLTVSFVNTSNLDSTWTWDFGDGNGDSIAEPAHEYAAPGTYTVTLVAGNSCGNDTLVEQITVANTGDCRLVLRPGPFRGKDALIQSRDDLVNNNFGVNTSMFMMTWTWSGILGTRRSLLEFDLDLIPSGAVVQSALLDLYFDNHPTSVHSGANNWLIQTIAPGAANAWNENTVAWSNQPLAGAPQVALPATTSPTQDFLNLNVTPLIQSMITNGNNGMMLRLSTESTYRRIRLATSDAPDPTMHPRLTIIFGAVSGMAVPDSTVICPGDTVQLTASGSDFYQWRPDLSLSCDTCPSTNAWPAVTQDYRVYIRDSVGCTDVDTVHVAVVNTCCQDTLEYTLQTTNPPCGNSNTGSITVNPTNGTAPYTFQLNGGTPQATGSFTGLLPGTYTVYYRDSALCDTSFSVTLTAPPALVLTLDSSQAPLCTGQLNGFIGVTASGGSAPYTYSINLGPGQASGLFTGLPAGNFLLIVTDGNGCQTSLTLNLPAPAPLAISVAGLNPISCFGANDGSVLVANAGGTPGYTWSLDGGPFGPVPIFSNLSPGSHTVTTLDANGCSASVSFTVTQPTPLNLTLIAQGNPACNGGSNGSLLVNGSGGTAPLSYSVDGTNFQPSGAFSGLSAGNYTVTVRDANNCLVTLSVTLTEPTPINITVDSLAGTACNNGYVGFSASGGTPPYLYSAGSTPFQPLNAFAGLPNGSQWIYVQDGAGCIDSLAIFVPNLPAVTVLPQITPISCTGANDGSVVLNGGGGTPPLTYSNGGVAYQPGNSFGNLAPGSYWFYVRDFQGCLDSVNIIFTDPVPLLVTASPNDITCTGAADGSAVLNASGGTFPYQYSLDGVNYSNNNVFGPLTAGNYTGFLIDARGCTATVTFGINEPAPLSLNLDFASDVTCFGGSNGIVQLSGTGGVAPLQYSLSGAGAQTSGSFTGLAAGSYTATLTDANNCTVSIPVTLNSPPELTASLVSTVDEICPGDANGEATVSASGGTGPYLYSLDNGPGNSSGSFANITAGGHQITVTDAIGCTTSLNFAIAPGTGPNAGFVVDFDPCTRPISAAFTNVSQDASLYEWRFGDGSTSADPDPLHNYADAGNYNAVLVATDANGCRDTSRQTVAIAPAPIAAFSSAPEIPAIIDQGGTVSFFNQSQFATGYLWSFGDGNESRGPEPFHVYDDVGEYCVQLVTYNPNGCTDTTRACLIQVINGNVYVPTAFTPNGDLVNDNFEIVTTALMDDWQLQIYDRWGKLIWETGLINEYWDGTFNGQPVPEGSYVYRLQARTVTGNTIDKSGSVTVFR